MQVFSLRLPKDLHAALQRCAQLRLQAMNDILLPVIQRWWSEQPEKAQVESESSVKTSKSGRVAGRRT